MAILQKVESELSESFAKCHTETERSCWRVYVAKDILRILRGRNPSHGDQLILDKFGIHV